MYAIGALFGPVVGPIIGGFIAQRAGWRWVFWVLLCACGTMTMGNIFLNSETNPSVLIHQKTRRLRKELGRPDLQSAYEMSQGHHANRKLSILARGISRPLRMLFGSAILFLLALYLSFVFGMQYLLFTTLTTLYINVYHWPVELCGLAYLGMGIGFFVGVAIVAKTSDATLIRLSEKNNNVYEPEMRLASCVLFAFLVPISFFWYGWAADKHVHWIVPIIGLFPFALGMIGIFLPIQTYFIDVGGKYAASSVAGLTALRCLFGAFLPLAGPAMYSSLGLGWGNSLLGFLAMGLIPVPALIYRYGKAIRTKFPITMD
jgi:MFS family permease